MKLQKQLNRHFPERGIWGDCLRTAIACVLDLDPVDVPHFNDRSDGRTDEDVGRLLNDWLRGRGLAIITVSFNGETSLDDVLTAAGFGSMGLPYLLSGFSRTGCNHVVVCQGYEIIWDPSLTDSGIVGPMNNGFWMVEWLVRPPV